MKELFKKFQTMMLAVTFAEEGEFETARQIMKEEDQKQKPGNSKSPAGTKLIRAN